MAAQDARTEDSPADDQQDDLEADGRSPADG
jgi:hypothetical protein